MTLAARLWLAGVLLPVSVLGAVLLGADWAFRAALERSLDQSLLTHIAAASVRIFDGPAGKPALRRRTTPLIDRLGDLAPVGLLFGPDGREIGRYPPDAKLPGPSELRRPGRPGEPPRLTTVVADGSRYRRIEATVASPAGDLYVMQLTSTMVQIDRAVATFRRVGAGVLLLSAALLAIAQTWLGRKLRRRLAALSEHAEALRKGDLERTLGPERERDEIATLRHLIAEATSALKQARDGKERLLADAAHELRTPLTLMRTSLDLALRKQRSNDELRASLADTRHEVERLAQLATRLLDSAALAQRSGAPERCDVVRLATEALEAARPEAEARGLALTLRAPPRVTAELRSLAVRQALDNLLSNALRYATRTIAIELEQDSERIALYVSDDGPGIPPLERELVFEPFHRLQHGGSGVGLGLAIVREVAHAHQGRAYVRESKSGATLALELRSSEHNDQIG